MIWSAPAAARWAAILGQPSRGLTRRSRDSAKLPMARAAMPIFSPSCGSTRMITGPARSKPDLVLSVPLTALVRFLCRFQGFEPGPEHEDSTPPEFPRLPAKREFLKQNMRLDSRFESTEEPSSSLAAPAPDQAGQRWTRSAKR